MIFKRVIALSLLLFAVVLSVSSHANDSNNSHKVYEMPPHKISDYIKSTSGQRRAIVIYASWCPTCVEKMPKIIDLENTKSGSVIAISVDENMINFVRYIKKIDDIPFRIIVNSFSEWKLAKSLKQFGVRPWETIPQVILMDKNNNVVRQGNYSPEYIAEFLFSDNGNNPRQGN